MAYSGAAESGRDAHPALARQRQRAHLLCRRNRPRLGPRRPQPILNSYRDGRPDVPIDSGALHHIENIGTDVAEFITAFRNERPEDFGLGVTFGAFTDAVLGNTYDLPASDMARIAAPQRITS
jgi:hypothetical protein